MPYDMMGNPGHEPMYKNIDECLNAVMTEIKAYEVWNGESEKSAVCYDFRGLGRFHERMGEKAYSEYACLGKKLADHPFGVITMPNWEEVAKAGKAGYFHDADLMKHLDQWCSLLKDMRKTSTGAAMYMAKTGELTLYGEMKCLVSDMENQIWAVEVLKDRITPDQYQHPDVKGVFKKLHTYFKDHYDPAGRIDYDL